MKPGKQLRPPTSERVPYEQALAQAYADGRLDLETYEQRMQQVAAAVSVGQLNQTVSDVPFTWPEEQAAEAAKKQSRRAFLLAGATVLMAGAGFGLGKLVPEPSRPVGSVQTSPRPSVAPPSPTPKPTPTPGGIATTMRQVPFGTPDSFGLLAAHLSDLGVTEFQRVYAQQDSVSVDGSRDGQPVDVRFRTDVEVRVEPADTRDYPARPVTDLEGINAADVLERTGREVDLGDGPTIDIRWFRQRWVIDVSGEEESVYWDMTGTQKVVF